MQVTHLAYRPWQIESGSLVFEADSSWSSKYDDDRELLREEETLGGVASVVAKPVKANDSRLPYLLVKDTFAAFETLARLNRRAFQGKVIAITGSVGKTTTKEMLRSLLSKTHRVYFSHNKLNNYRGLVNNVAECHPQVDYAIYECGMAKIGSIENKSQLAHPHIALITDIQPDHLKHHKNIKSIARTKAEIFKGMDAHGIAILNHDNEYYDFLHKKAQRSEIKTIISFGQSPQATIRLKNYHLSAQGCQVTLQIDQQIFNYHLSVLGKSSVYNSLAAFAVIYALNLPLPTYINALSHFTAPEQRGELFDMQIQGKPIRVIDQRYNSNLASLKACADNLVLISQASEKKTKTTFMLGDMEQLGSFAEDLHQQAAAYLAACEIDEILYFGQYGELLAPYFKRKNNFHSFAKPKELLKYFLQHLKKDAIMTIKGSWSNDEFDNMIKKLRRMESR